MLYHSLQTRVQKRFSNGLQLVVNYTHSKAMQYLQYSAVNVRKWRTVSPIDYPHMFNLFLTYQMPFGRGRNVGERLVATAGHGRRRLDHGVHHPLPERRRPDRYRHQRNARANRRSGNRRRIP